MMGPRFWRGLAEKIGVRIEEAGAPLVKVASAATGKVEVVDVPDKIVLSEATEAGFFRLAKPMGWGLYRVEDIDGGLGSIWFVEKDADGNQFLVKQTDPEGDVLRKVASAPPGMEDTVKELKKKEDGVDNPWAVAWSIYKKKKKADAVGGMADHSAAPARLIEALEDVDDGDVIIKEAAEKCPQCGKPMKENTEGNPRYCQGHD